MAICLGILDTREMGLIVSEHYVCTDERASYDIMWTTMFLVLFFAFEDK